MIFALIASAFSAPLLVGIDESPPFAYREDGKWIGISVELWESIAAENHWEYQYVEKSFSELLLDLSNDELDIVIPAVTITPERESLFDFSYPYLIEDIAIATNKTNSIWTVSAQIIDSLFEPIICLLISLLVAGSFYHLFEKKDLTFRGLLDSVYWALTTMTTVGYGDEAPKGPAGRIFSMFWMFIALFIFAFINAQMIGVFSSVVWTPNIDDLSDLRNENVITISETFSDELLNHKMIKHETIPIESEIKTIQKKESVFIVYDRSILKYYLSKDPKIIILDNGFYHQYLAFAIRTKHPLSEEINHDLINTINTEWWKSTLFKYEQ